MIELYRWNPVYNFVFSVKNQFIKRFGNVEYKEYELNGKTITCLEYWIETLDRADYREKIKYLELNQKENFLLVRYAKYSDVLSGEEEVTLDDIWNMYDGFYLECRSIVLDLQREEIVILPFKKFRNLNECEENMLENVREEINSAKNVEISNKLDGSMQCARYYHGKIFMSGSQAVDPQKSWRLEDGYRMLKENKNYCEMIQFFPSTTFIFEYISLADAHVVKYSKEEEGLYLVGMRDSLTGKQYSYKAVLAVARRYDVKCTQAFDKTLEDVLEEIKTIKSEDQEGFVLNIIHEDDSARLIKIKGDDYVHIHKILSKLSSINLIIRAIADECVDDLRSKVPAAYKSRVDILEKIARDFVTKQERIVNEYYYNAPKSDKKTFMIWVEKNVPREYKPYVRNCWLGIKNNYLKSHTETNNPRYIKLVEMGVKREDYTTIFSEE